eukprot:366343-Chlamydomonas_euryale.AAC.12
MQSVPRVVWLQEGRCSRGHCWRASSRPTVHDCEALKCALAVRQPVVLLGMRVLDGVAVVHTVHFGCLHASISCAGSQHAFSQRHLV